MNIKQVNPFQPNQYQFTKLFPDKRNANPFTQFGNNHNNANQVKRNQPLFFKNSTIPLARKFVTNVNEVSCISLQEKAVAFGHDRDENYFKRSLRKKSQLSAIKSTYYNLVNNYNSPRLRGEDKKRPLNSPHHQQLSTIKHLAGIIKEREQEEKTGRLKKFNTNLIDGLGNRNNSQKIEIKSKDQKEYYKQNCSAIKEYAYYEDANYYYRKYMEDKGEGIDAFNNIPTDALFCLYDGHGGVQVSQFLRDNLSEEFKQMLPSKDISSSFNDLFETIDNKIRLFNCSNVGSTACAVYITKEQNAKVLYCANIGDTRCVLVSKDGSKRLSYDHRPTDKSEYERIIKAGGKVFDGRIYGQLMLSRCFGDFKLKPYGVVSSPFVSRIEIGKDDEYIIIASDGVWDVLEEEDVFKLTKGTGNSNDLVHVIAKTALMKGSVDNISCFVIKI